MLSDVGNLWFTASSAIAQALEKLDSDMIQASREGSNAAAMEEVNDDLEAYKKLLDDAQMQHLELSKQSRLLLAEKDAEIKFLKAQMGDSSAAPDENSGNNREGSSVDGGLLLQKVLSEKIVLETSLREIEDQLRDAVHAKNDLQVLSKSHEELKRRFEIMRQDFAAMKLESEQMEKQRTETIENLASEYSRLAAEAEMIRQKSDTRVSQVLKENEILVTKMHALEHSIAELADRSVSVSSPKRLSGSSSTSAFPKAAGDDNDVPTAVVVETVAPATTTVTVADPAVAAELKEAKARIVNLQYDLKEREEQLQKLKDEHNEAITELTSQQQLQKQQLLQHQQELLKLEQQQQEGKLQQQQLQDRTSADGELQAQIDQQAKLLQQQKDEHQAQLTRQLEEQRQQAADAAASLVATHQTQLSALEATLRAAQAEQTSWQQRAEAAQKEIDQLKVDIQLLQAQSQASMSEGAAALTAQYEAQLTTLRASLASLEEQQAAEKAKMEAEVAKLLAEVQESAATLLAQREEHVAAIAALSSEHETKLESIRVAFAQEKGVLEAQVAAVQASSSADRDQVVADFLAQIATLESDLRLTKETHQTALATHEVALQTLADQHAQALETATNDAQRTLAEALQEAKESKDAAFALERSALETQIADLRTELAQAQQATVDLEARLVSEHAVQLEATSSAIRQEMATQQEEALAAKESQLQEVFATEKAQLATQHQSLLSSALETLTAQLTAEKVQELAALIAQKEAAFAEEVKTLQAAAEAAQKTALEQLALERDATQQAALQAQADAHKQELEAQLQALKEVHAGVLQALTAEKNAEIEGLQQTMQTLRAEMQVIEDKHAQQLKTALASLEAEKAAELTQAVQTARTEMQGLVDKAYAERDEHLANYSKERLLRKKIHNKLLEIQGNIRVICRVRPINDVERRSGEDVDVTEIPNEDELLIQRDPQTKAKYEYDRVFGQQSTQSEVFEAVQPLCVSVLDGYNVCIFAYGQTGSGKTYTMEGYGDPGVTPRAMMELFKQVEALSNDWTYTLTLSMLEIYNETIHDLLNSSGGSSAAGGREKLDVRQTAEGNVVVGLTDVPITSMEQVRDLMRQGQANRAVGKHDMNEHSSRSHSIVTVTARGRNRLDNATTFGKLHLIDLAGSERLSKTDASGDRLKEAQNINKSLLALGDVINALGNKKSLHIPYRNSKLTFLLQDSLGGNSKVLTFVNISPAVYNLGETVCSLNFATRCRSTELGQAKKQSATSSASSGEGGGETPNAARQLLAEKRKSSLLASSGGASSSNLLASATKK